MLKVSKIFQTGMVIQRDEPFVIWGTAEPRETVRVMQWEVLYYVATVLML